MKQVNTKIDVIFRSVELEGMLTMQFDMRKNTRSRLMQYHFLSKMSKRVRFSTELHDFTKQLGKFER